MNWNKANEEKAALKAKLEKEHGVENNPKRELLFSLAWDYGHAYGEIEVGIFYDEMVGLIQ